MWLQDDNGGAKEDAYECYEHIKSLGRRCPTVDADGMVSKRAGIFAFIYFQEEVGKDGKLHLQGGFNLGEQRKMTIASVKAEFEYDGIHIENCRKDPEFNYNYCKKDEEHTGQPGTFMEFGIKPWDRHAVDQAMLGHMLERGITPEELANNYPITYMKYGQQYERTYKARQAYAASKRPKRNGCRTDVRWGITGAGKTTGIYNSHGRENVYVWCYDETFQSYGGQDVLLFDEFDGQVPISKMKQLCDSFPMKLSVKGERAVDANWSQVRPTSTHVS